MENENNKIFFDGIRQEEKPSTTHSKSEESPMPKQGKGLGGVILEIVKFTLIALFIVIPFRVFVAQPFIVNGASMDPTFNSGQYLIVDQISYRFEPPERGSVIIFKYPKDTSKFFIKRVIGLPGETVEIKNGIVTIKNSENPQGFVLEEPYVIHPKEDNLKVTLEDSEYFVMGDNRAGSSDSRIWGPLKEEFITGRAFARLLPIGKLEIFPGRY